MANLDRPSGFRFYKSLAGHGENVRAVLASGQTVEAGDLLALGPANKLRIATPADMDIYGVSEGTHVVTEDTVIDIYPWVPWYQFRAQVSGSYTADMVGSLADFEGTTGIMEVNENLVLYGHMVIVELVPEASNAVGANADIVVIPRRSSYLGTGTLGVPTRAVTEAISASTKTLDADDTGKWMIVTQDSVITLPSVAAGLVFNIVNGGPDFDVQITVDPAAADWIRGIDLGSHTDGFAIINTKATARAGDYVKLVSEGVNGWYVTEIAGIWASAGA